MTDGTWLNRDHQVEPGVELFRSDRRFCLEAYSASHGQLLLRSVDGDDGLGRRHDTTIEISGAGVFLTPEDAEDARAQIATKFTDSWIEPLPVAL